MLQDADDLSDDGRPDHGAHEHQDHDEDVLGNRCGRNVAVADARERVQGKVRGYEVGGGGAVGARVEHVACTELALDLHHTVQPGLADLVVAQGGPGAAHEVDADRDRDDGEHHGPVQIRDVHLELQLLHDVPEAHHPQEPHKLQQVRDVELGRAVRPQEILSVLIQLAEGQDTDRVQKEKACEVRTDNPAMVKLPHVPVLCRYLEKELKAYVQGKDDCSDDAEGGDKYRVHRPVEGRLQWKVQQVNDQDQRN
mmetsp:Transcript_25118/g.56992  ORF Transcript_25118/g.56992 Transcript_25118/m.56992 type:complete len:253 (+) Transcript_25118:75-833(+)